MRVKPVHGSEAAERAGYPYQWCRSSRRSGYPCVGAVAGLTPRSAHPGYFLSDAVNRRHAPAVTLRVTPCLSWVARTRTASPRRPLRTGRRCRRVSGLAPVAHSAAPFSISASRLGSTGSSPRGDYRTSSQQGNGFPAGVGEPAGHMLAPRGVLRDDEPARVRGCATAGITCTVTAGAPPRKASDASAGHDLRRPNASVNSASLVNDEPH